MKKIKLLIIPLMVLILTGCSIENGNPRKCIKSHTETKWLFVYNGHGVSVIPIKRTICDKYEEEE